MAEQDGKVKDKDKVKGAKKQYPCDQRVKCGYPGCSFFGRLRSLDRHQNRRHPNQPKRIANAGFGEGGTWSNWRIPQACVQGGYLSVKLQLLAVTF